MILPASSLSHQRDESLIGRGIEIDFRFHKHLTILEGLSHTYSVKGFVSGKDLYLVLISNDQVYYTAKMSKESEGNFLGKASYGTLVDSEAAKTAENYLIRFRKM